MMFHFNLHRITLIFIGYLSNISCSPLPFGLLSSQVSGNWIKFSHVELPHIMVRKVFPPTLTLSNIKSSFRVSGIYYRFDCDVFNNQDFLPSDVTDRPMVPCHQLNAIIEWHYWMPLLNAIIECHQLNAIIECHYWMPSIECHYWMPLLNATNWMPLLNAIIECHQLNAIIECH